MAASEAPVKAGGTRERLLVEGLRLFAERGFDSVSVGDIERAAGLVPRRGALYRHFPSKDDLLRDAVRDYLASVVGMRSGFAEPAPDDLHRTATALARRLLADLDRLHDITRVLERDGDRLPELRETFRRDVVEHASDAMAELLAGWWRVSSAGPRPDLRAWAVHLLGALVNTRRSTWTFGSPPGGLDDDRAARAWADLVVRLLDGSG